MTLDNDQSKENDDKYPTVAEEEVEDIDNDLVEYDEINLLGILHYTTTTTIIKQAHLLQSINNFSNT